jgi:hypothetical protein
MAYSSFTLDEVVETFGLKVREGSFLGEAGRVAATPWLRETLAKYLPMAFISEKSRCECVIAPILTACRELLENEVYFYSGITFDVDPVRGLVGECDYLFACTAPTPVLEAPFLVVVEAKKDDLYQGLGQCAAQMLAARILNERRNRIMPCIHGCVTTGREWQFLKLEQNDLLIDGKVLFINDLELILGTLAAILRAGLAHARILAA